ncbi:SANT/Myb domain [Dillenia turbinata]|uniref:SANT/Myb domain n=1 Tax=Dillenia turbinata TaxID=194707 RepID=A0AAN8ZMQ1_9MAGN
MSASPSFHTDSRNKWKKRKRDPQIKRKRHQSDEDALEDDDEDEDNNINNMEAEEDDDQAQPTSNPNSDRTRPARESEVLADAGVRISDFPVAIKRAVNRPHASVLAIVAAERATQSGDTKSLSPLLLENVSYGQLQALPSIPADSPSLVAAEAASSYVITPPPIVEGRGVVKKYGGNRVHVVPMHSDWFSPTTVHRLERQVVPHFFTGKSDKNTPEKYMECRNRIVAKYMESPEKRILISDCEKLVNGIDEEDLTRIVRFLDHWGIINYCAAASVHELWNGGDFLKEDMNGEVHVPSDALKAMESLVQFDRPKCRLKRPDVCPLLPCNNNEDSDLDTRIRERLLENRCNYCSRALAIVYYQSQKEVDVFLCPDCFHEGRFVTGHSSIDFVRVDSTKDYGDLDAESWTDQETLLLLEAMELYNDNWNEIAEHVGTKSKAQCILHFVRMPMEDRLLENIDVPAMLVSNNLLNEDDSRRSYPNSNGGPTASNLQEPDAESKIPFGNSGNPVMSLVAFLASSVGPRVAAASAHASLAALSEEDKLGSAGNMGKRISENIYGRDGGPQGQTANSSQQKDDNSEREVMLLSTEKVQNAAKAGLAAAAIKAKLFADHEEREIQRLAANIINHQLKRLELKLKQFAEVETLLMKECEQVERARQRLAAERVRIISTRFGSSAVSSPTSLPAVGAAVVNNNAMNSRQQVMSAAPTQPSIPGYGNSQMVHPQMPFMPRQPMYAYGPRLPLSAINPSTSGPSNAMFNSPGNSQPTLNHPMMRPVTGSSSGLG